MTDLAFAELHSPLFHAGKNHGTKLISKHDLKLQYDEEKQELRVTYHNRVSRIPKSALQSFEEVSALIPPPPVNVPSTMDINKIQSAQVETPTTHVFKNDKPKR